jgi:formate hydrogenlyase subunit 6/NADH:ubiquinone oxidoreductase subunit I
MFRLQILTIDPCISCTEVTPMTILPFAGTVFRNLISRPAYPAGIPDRVRAPLSATRGHIEIAIDACIFQWTVRTQMSDPGAIQVTKAAKEWTIERLRCIQCNSCVEVCPKKCLMMAQQYTQPSTGPVRDIFHA